LLREIAQTVSKTGNRGRKLKKKQESKQSLIPRLSRKLRGSSLFPKQEVRRETEIDAEIQAKMILICCGKCMGAVFFRNRKCGGKLKKKRESKQSRCPFVAGK